MAEAHEELLAGLDLGDEVIDLVVGADLLEHPQDGLVGTAVTGPVEGAAGCREQDVGIGMGTPDRAGGGGGAVLAVVGVKHEQQVERPG